MIRLRIRAIVEGADCCSDVAFSEKPVSFLGDTDVRSGIIKGVGEVSGKILLLPASVGSTVGSYVLYALSKNGKAPLAIVTSSIDPIIVTGAVISNIPLYQLLEPWNKAKNILMNGSRRGCIIKGEYLVID